MTLIYRYSHCPINPDDPPALKQSSPGHPYKTVGCVFNHQSFYANSQVTENKVNECEQPGQWGCTVAELVLLQGKLIKIFSCELWSVFQILVGSRYEEATYLTH